ncbi:MAG: MBL fold metallo-hydrolase [Prevotella sp.]|nr:MBL fold metallo-hydrolase [Prevotella sp.]
MLTIKKFIFNPLQENTYVVHDETHQAVIIDCGAFYSEEREALKQYITEQGLLLKHLLCTHGHLDHCFGNCVIARDYGICAEVSAADDFLIEHLDHQASNMFGFHLEDEVPPVGRYLTETDIISFGTHQLTIISTPGHTPGSVVYWCEAESVAFTGDTLFSMSIGRTDFERGSYRDMMSSLQRLKQTLPPETTLYCGHGPDTTMQQELRMNMYLR